MTSPLSSKTKLEQSVVSSHLHTHRTFYQPHPLLKLPSSPSVCSLRQKYPNFSPPAILQRRTFLILSIIRSSCPPSHHWDSTLLVWIVSHWSVFQGGLGRGGIQSTSTSHWGSPGVSSWTAPLRYLHYITGSHHTSTWLILPLLRWWLTALSLISTRWSNGSCTHLRLPGRHLCMDERTSPIAQHDKDWTSCLPFHSNYTAWFHHPARFFYYYPINFGQKCWCNLWWPAALQGLHCKKIKPFLTEHAAQLLVKGPVVSRLDYSNALLAGLPENTIKPLQMIQNAASRLVFSEPKKSLCYTSLYFLSLATRYSSHQVQELMLAYRTATGSAPSYFHSLLQIYISSRSLRSASELRLVVPSQRGSKSLSRTFSFTIPGWWNDLPTPIRNY